MGQTACREEGVGRCADAGYGATVGNGGWYGAVEDAAPKVGVVAEEMVDWCFSSLVGSDAEPVLKLAGPLFGCFVGMLMFGRRGSKSDIGLSFCGGDSDVGWCLLFDLARRQG